MSGPAKYRIVEGYTNEWGRYVGYCLQKKTMLGGWRPVVEGDQDKAKAYMRQLTNTMNVVALYDALGNKTTEQHQAGPNWAHVLAGFLSALWLVSVGAGAYWAVYLM